MAVTLNRIYTRGGDTGMTSLGRGERVAKHDIRVNCLAPTAATSGTPIRTPPASVLCAMPVDCTFITTGKPISFAAATAAARSFASTSRVTGMP